MLESRKSLGNAYMLMLFVSEWDINLLRVAHDPNVHTGLELCTQAGGPPTGPTLAKELSPGRCFEMEPSSPALSWSRSWHDRGPCGGENDLTPG